MPLYDGARELLALGYSPRTVVRVRHAGTIAMRGVIGELAKWTIEESDRGGLRKRLWKGHSPWDGSPPAADDASEAELALGGAALLGDHVAKAA
jgi:hypothetical protein